MDNYALTLQTSGGGQTWPVVLCPGCTAQQAICCHLQRRSMAPELGRILNANFQKKNSEVTPPDSLCEGCYHPAPTPNTAFGCGMRKYPIAGTGTQTIVPTRSYIAQLVSQHDSWRCHCRRACSNSYRRTGSRSVEAVSVLELT